MNILDYHVRTVIEESPFHYYRVIQTDKIDESVKDPAFPSTSTRDFVIEDIFNATVTCVKNVPADLKIRTNLGSAIVNDDYTVVADPDDEKFIKMSLVRDDTSTDLEILAFEKTTGEYASIPAGKTLELDLKEFLVVAAGTSLNLEQSWI